MTEVNTPRLYIFYFCISKVVMDVIVAVIND